MKRKGYELEERSDGAFQIIKRRPYDDADYYWAFSKDKLNWNFNNNHHIEEQFIDSFSNAVDRLEELNKNVKSKMCHN